MKLALFLTFTAAAAAQSSDPLLAKSCVGCHGVRIIQVQRLSKGAWERELDKMARWGWPAKDREAVLNHLVQNFGDDKPAAAPVMSQDGRKK